MESQDNRLKIEKGEDTTSIVTAEVVKFKEKKFENYNKQHFEKQTKINSGSFGNIYLYKDVDSGEKIVKKIARRNVITLKTLDAEAKITDKVGTQGAIYRAKRRAQKGYALDIRLSAPHVIPTEKGLVMEFVEKGDLTCKHEEIDVYEMFKQTTKLLNDLHKDGYVHRDIKPANLLLGKDEKIRLADLDSVVKARDCTRKNAYFTVMYADVKEHYKPSGNRRKLDIYSTAVSTLEYAYGEDKFIKETYPFGEYCLSNIEASTILKKNCICLAKKLRDKEFGKILSNMLNGKYESMEEVLKDFDKTSIAIDKKSLKIALSYISNPKVETEILNALAKRKKIIYSLRNNKILSIIFKPKLHKINSKISNLLIQNCPKSDIKKYTHICNVSKNISGNKFTNHFFTITEKTIENQRRKNISIEKKLSNTPLIGIM